MKIGIKTFFKNSVIAVFAASFIFAFSSCEIGLGAAVDTDAPLVESIVSPRENVARRSSIHVAGTCSDDTGVDYLKVLLINNDYPDDFRVEWDELKPTSGTDWSFDLDYYPDGEGYNYKFKTGNGEKNIYLPDGTYVLELVAVDTSGRMSGKLSRAFDIDNTPPIFLLSTPTSISSEDLANFTKFGKTISLKGTISDDHLSTDKDSVKVRMYPRESDGSKGTEIDIPVKDFIVSDAANATIVLGRYADSPSTGIENNYKTAYTDNYANGANKNQQFYLEVDIYDNAIGPNATTGLDAPIDWSIVNSMEDLDSNKNTKVYVREKLLALTNEIGVGTTLEGSDFRQIWNGTYKGAITNAQRSTIISALNGDDATLNEGSHKYLGCEETPLAINVNKNVSPTYYFPSFEIADDLNFHNVNNDSVLSFTVSQGVDKAKVVPSSIRAKIYEYSASGAKPTAKPTSLTQLGTCVWDSGLSSSNLFEADTKTPLFQKNINVDSATYSFKLPGIVDDTHGVHLSRYYYVVLEGQDASGDALENLNGQFFGFYTSTSGAPPSIEASNKTWVKYATGATYPFEVRITDSMGMSDYHHQGADGITGTVKRYNGYYESEASLPSLYNWHRALNISEFNSNTLVSGTNEFKEIISLNSFELEPVPGVTPPTYFTTYTYLLDITATNVNGSSSRKKYLIYVDAGAPSITFNDSALNASATPLRVEESNNYYAKVDGKNTYKLHLSLADTNGSGIDSYTYSVTQGGTVIATGNVDGAGADNITVIHDIPDATHNLVEGPATINVQVTDKVGNGPVTESKTVYFDFSAPEFTAFPSASNTEKDAWDFTVSAHDTYLMDDIVVTATKDDGTVYNASTSGFLTNVTYSDDQKTASRTIHFNGSQMDGSWVVNCVAKDKSGRTTPKSFNMVFDSTKPVIGDNFTVPGVSGTFQYNGENNYFSLNSPVLNLTVNEPTSGLDSVYYILKKNTDEPPLSDSDDVTGWTRVATSGKGAAISVPLSASGYLQTENGVYNVLYVRAKDVAGNVSDKKAFNVNIDVTPPRLDYICYSIGSGSETVVKPASSVLYRKNVPVTLYGTASDGQTGLDSIEFSTISPTSIYYSSETVTEANATSITWVSSISESGSVTPLNVRSWKAVYPASTTPVTLTATPKDKAGLEGNDVSLGTLIEDTTPPQIYESALSIQSNTVIKETSMTDNGDGTYKLTVSGKWSDDASGTAWLKYRYSEAEDPNHVLVDSIATNIKTPAVGWSFSLDVVEGTGQSIELVYADNAGNENTVTISDLTIDTGAPTLVVNNQASYNLTSGNITSAGKATITINAADSLGIAGIEISAKKDDEDPVTETNASLGIGINPGSSGTTATGSITLTAPNADGKWNITVTATDLADRPVTKNFSLVFDGTAPVINDGFKIKDQLWSESLSYYNSTTLKFSGTVNESVAMGKILYKISDDSTLPTTLSGDSSAKTVYLNGKGNAVDFYATDNGFSVDSTEHPCNYLYIQAFDKEGNSSIVKKYPVHVDTNAPEFSVTHYQNGNQTPVEIQGKVLTKGDADFIVYGTYEDTGSGVDGIDFFLGSENINSKVSVSYAPAAVTDFATYTGWINTINDSNKNLIKHWKAVVTSGTNLDYIAGKTVSAKPKDKAGNGSVKTAFALTIDDRPPEINSAVISGAYREDDSTGTFDAIYYVNNSTFTFSGTSTDNYGVTSTVYTLKKGSEEIASGSATAPSVWSFTLSFTDLSTWGNGNEGVLTVVSTDEVGRTAEKNYKIIIDSVGPSFLSNMFKASYTYNGAPVYKDSAFFVGGGKYSESTFTNKTSIPVAGYFEEKGSGMAKLYYQICHPGDTPMTLSTYETSSTGVITSLPRCAGNKPTDSSGNELKKYQLNAPASGDVYGTPKVNPSTQEIEKESYTNSTYYSFSEVLNGFRPVEGGVSDKLYLIAVDNCGNTSLRKEVKINVDQTVSVVDSDSGETKLTNGEADIVLTGTAEDDLSGLEIINFVVGHDPLYIPAYDSYTALNNKAEINTYLSQNPNAAPNSYSSYGKVRFYKWDATAEDNKGDLEKIDYSKTDAGAWSFDQDGTLPPFYMQDGSSKVKWELTITPRPEWFSEGNLGTTPVVYANVKDWAGNAYRYPVATLKVDTTPPTTVIDSPNTDVHNGTFDVLGTVSDGPNAPKSVYLYKASGTAPTDLNDWDLVGAYTTDRTEVDAARNISLQEVSKIYHCTFAGIDLNEFAGSSGTGTGYLMLVACDEAGNWNVDKENITSANYTTYTVDMNTDRPVVKFNEITNNGLGEPDVPMYTSKYSSRIYGTVTDDDGVAEIKIASSLPDNWATYSQPAGTLNYTPGSTSVSFNYVPQGTSDGVKTLYIYIKDTAGNAFWTSNSPTWKQPKAVYAGTTAETDLDSEVKYRSDSTPPTVRVVSGYGTTAAAAQTKALANLEDGKTMGVSEVFGGTERMFMSILVAPYDTNGISSVAGTDFENDSSVPYVKIDDVIYTYPDGRECPVYVYNYNVSELTSGQSTLTVTASDTSGLDASSVTPVIFDNDGPVITVSTNQNTVLTGLVEIAGTTYDQLGSNVSALWCFIPDDTYYNSDGSLLSSLTASDYSALKSKLYTDFADEVKKDSLLSWSVEFDQADSTKLYRKLPSTAAELASYTKVSHTEQDIYTLDVFVLAKDELGNESVHQGKITYNPYGNRPIATIVSPAPASGSTDLFAKASGNIRVAGTARDNEAVDKVFIQIALGDSDNRNTAAGINLMKSGSKWDRTKLPATYTVKTVSDLWTGENRVYSNDSSLYVADTEFWGIEVRSTGSWYTVLNKLNDLQMEDALDEGSTDTYTVWVRAAAVDINGLLGPWSNPLPISINPKSPAIGNHVPKVYFYSDAAMQNKVGEKEYVDDMWVKGYAALITTAEHANGISSITSSEGEYQSNDQTVINHVVDGEIGDGTGAVAEDFDGLSTTGTNGKEGYTIKVPLSTNTGNGTREVRVTAIEGSETALFKEQLYTFRYDNTAPNIQTLLANGDVFENNKKLQNSNLQLTVGGTVTDGTDEVPGSGFSKLLFAFYRGSSTVKVIDSQVSGQTVTVDSTITTKEVAGQNIYGKTYSITWAADSSTQFSYTGSADSFVRKGGTVMIGDVWYIISAVSGTNITIAESASTDVTTAFFPYMQVVDNTSAETLQTWTESGHTFKNSRDDGDGMPESVSKSGNTWTWDATLHGNYMADGPVTFVVLAMDNAGNISAATRTGSIENNPPRLAKVYLGTDLNNNNKFEDSEFELYDIHGVTSMYQDAYDLTTAGYSTVSGSGKSVVVSASTRPAFKITNKLALYAELVGGNGEKLLVFNREAEDAESSGTDDDGVTYIYPTPTQGSGTDLIHAATANFTGNTKVTSGYVLSNVLLTGKEENTWTASDDGPKVMSFTIWDSTEELISGQTTQSCVLRIMDLELSLTDKVPPRTVIEPLYWNSGSDNSLYKNSKANGHIELDYEWKKEGTSYLSTAVNGQYDGDPKVSGKVTFTGYAYDETMIKSLLMNFGGMTFTSHVTNGFCSGGTYAVGDVECFEVANYTGTGDTGWNVASPSMADDFWEIAVEPVYFDQRGHKVRWTLSVDTSKISGSANKDVKLLVYAMDGGYTTSPADDDTTKVDGVENKSKYQMDVVPYILGLRTSLSTTGRTFYDRTALGHFPVNMSTSFFVYGFNLETEATFKDNKSHSVSLAAPGANDPASYNGYSLYKVSASTLYSGKFTVTVNNMVSINNMNDNDAKGKYNNTKTYSESKKNKLYDNYPNRFPDGVTNNNLTDDMEIDVWQFNSSAASTSGKTDDPHMEINPNNGMLGFSFLDGAMWFAMPESSDNSYKTGKKSTIDFMVSGYFTYDTAGNTYGCSAGQDSDDNKADPFWVYGKKGDGNYRIELTGQVGKRVDGENHSGRDTESYNLKNKIKNPVMATYLSGTTTNVYIAYYDSWNGEIRFRGGKVSGSTYSGNIFRDAYKTKTINENSGNNVNAGYYSCRDAQVIATSFKPTETSISAKYDGAPLGGAGPYVSIATVPASAPSGAGTVVLVWYDAAAKCTRYTYNTNPLNEDWRDTSNHFCGLNHANWSGAKTIFEGAGEFCQVKVDGKGGVHIAAYDSIRGDVRYARLASYTGEGYSEATDSCIVDSRSVVGKQLTLDVGLVNDVDDNGTITGSHAVPYIGYVYDKYPKLAKLVSTDFAAGASEDFFTGNWEVTYVPTPKNIYKVDSSSPNNSRINVGVWKNNSTGVVTSYTGGETTDGNKVYGNGTDYPILGYQVWATAPDTTVETAQMR